ncbi:uncharacterized protein [Battus philenor]|uniref:uncharacterized protein isoform X2 n=1 Tax=Battus philenor TaxID=42288 RepID=UPI0035CEB862
MDENSSVTSSIDLSKINNDLSNLILDNESSRSTNKLEDMSEKGNLSELMNTERNELSYYDFYKAVEENLNKLDGYNKEPANNDTNLTMSNLNDIVSCNGHVPLQNTEESDFLKNCMIEVGNGVLSKLGIEDGTQLINPNEAITDDMTYDGCITLQKQSNKVFKESMVVAPDNPVENTIKELRIEDSTKIMNTDISKLTKNVENSNVSELPNEDSGLTSYEELSDYIINFDSSSASNKQNVVIPVTAQIFSKDIKVLWLKSTLSFIKNEKQNILKYPRIPSSEKGFIEAIIHHNYEADIDTDFKAVYLSIREAMTIFKNKYEFLLKTLAKNKNTVQLVLEKVPRNSDVKFKIPHVNKESSKLSEKRLKKRNKMIVEKVAVVDAAPVPFIMDALEKILSFLDDSMSASVIFKNLPPKQWKFLMNIKVIVKMRRLLVNELPAKVNKLLDCIGTHKDYGFNLVLLNCKFIKSKRERSVSLMKTPKFSPITKPDEIDESSMDETSTKSTNTSCERSISPSAERTDSGLEENVTTENQSPSITTKSCHSSDEPNSPVEKTAPSCVQENATAVVKEQACNIVNSYHSSIERIEPRTKLKTTIQFQPGGQPESPNERNEIESIEPSTSMTMNTPPNQQHCFRGRSLDRRTDSMKSKLVEGLSVPLECEKAKRMMQLMGWNGGGLGTRGEGITEPIMPALGIVSGAGLGHNNYAPNNFMNVPPYPGSVYSGDIFDEMSFVDPWTKSWRIKQDTETRLYILSNLLDFVSSYERHKVLTFHVPLVSSEINFLYPVIRSLNEGTFVALETNYERTMFYKIQNAMMGTTEIQLAATILTGGREIQLSKVYEDNGNMVTEVEYYDCPRKCLSVEVYMIGLRSIKDYVFYSSKSFRSFAFRHMMLQEILEFVESDEIAIYYDFVGSLHKKQLRFLYVFFENLNIRQREKALTPHEDLVTEQIYNKLGDYYLNLDIISHHKQIKLQKKYRNKRDYKKRVSSNNTYIKKDVWANNEIKQCITKNVAVQCIEAEFRQYQILKMREDGTKKAKDRQKDVLQDIKEKNKQKENKECKNEDIKKPDSEKEAEGLKKDIEGLQASIAKVDCICKTDKNKCKINELKIFREIYLKSTNEQEIITVNSVRFIQKLISDAIDACDNFLPLLQCHGIVDDKLFYSCYNEETYSWIKTVIGDKFIITDSAMQSGSSHRLQMKIKSFIDYDTAKILNTVKLYNPELDLSGWTVEKKIISIDFILIDIEVDSVSYNFISQCNFSLFMGIDRAQFSVIWN